MLRAMPVSNLNIAPWLFCTLKGEC
ncbi:hypothetical protein CNECB9_1150005 [Cupriavidus necator]|uniref:Uncharacterized protein n=1 Tax=Cupriavidus necator TaxID=106590 RepID=A0A1K0I880_CUPNE|nr:hypothetical protein CNECB9_1150005 [Cupriavidus necator]